MPTPKSRPSIKAPRLPKTLPLAELPRDIPADGETCSRLEYQHLDLADQTISRLHFEEVIFSQLSAAASQFPYLRAVSVCYNYLITGNIALCYRY